MQNSEFMYSPFHSWAHYIEDQIVLIGITEYAADSLGEVVYVGLPLVGDSVTSGMVMGEIESSKAFSDLYSPVDGIVIEVNDIFEEYPEIVNSDPYVKGWMIKVELSSIVPEDLMTKDQYLELNE
jgi:glycine cleavage system H protein